MQTLRMIFVVTALLAGVVAPNVPFSRGDGAQGQGTALRVYTSDGFKPALQALLPQIERTTGEKVSTEFEASKTLQQKIQAGEAFDVAILGSGNIDDLIQAGKIARDTRADLGRAGIGVGLRAGSPKPDIGTPEAMKQALLHAKSITFNRDGASAVHIHEMVERLGITDQLQPKLLLEAGAGQPQEDVIAGKAEMVITLMPEISDFQGLELVGPLPGELQSYISFSAGVAANSQHAAAARALIKFLTALTTAPILKAKGIDTR
jgi:molybdate transport system substrate-binding protein